MTVPLRIDAVDRVLPGGGLSRGGLHEVLVAETGGGAAALGFAAWLLSQLAGLAGMVLWCRLAPGRSGCRLYGPGLASFGLDPARLLIIHARTDTELFWTMEEGLRSGALAAVLGETAAERPVALRRLQLAAESHGTPALLLRPARTAATGTGPPLTRWQVAPVAGRTIAAATTGDAGSAVAPRAGDPVRPRWRVRLLRCRGVGLAGPAVPGDDHSGSDHSDSRAFDWVLDKDDATGGFRVAADFRHRPAEPRPHHRGAEQAGHPAAAAG